MINCMKTTINEQKQFDFLSKDAKIKKRWSCFIKKKKRLNLVSYSLNSSSKDIDYLYLPAMENFHE